MLPFSVVAFGFLNFSATTFFSLVGFWLTFVVGFSEAGETNTFFGILFFFFETKVGQDFALVDIIVVPRSFDERKEKGVERLSCHTFATGSDKKVVRIDKELHCKVCNFTLASK
jgi:hypothetical protein